VDASPSPDGLSALRKELRTRYENMAPLLEPFLERSPLLKGCVYIAKGRCGRAGCHCAKGALHTSTVLAYRGGGRQCNRCPPEADLPLLRGWTSAYQRFRKARVQWAKEAGGVLKTAALLEQARLKEGERLFRKTEVGKKMRRSSP